MHFLFPEASTSVWNNCRDKEVEFDWAHMFQHTQEQLKRTWFANQRQQKHFFFNLKYACV